MVRHTKLRLKAWAKIASVLASAPPGYLGWHLFLTVRVLFTAAVRVLPCSSHGLLLCLGCKGPRSPHGWHRLLALCRDGTVLNSTHRWLSLN